MPNKKYKPEDIVAKLRQADVLISQDQDIADVIRQIGVSQATYYQWRPAVQRAEDRAAQGPEGAGDGECPPS